VNGILLILGYFLPVFGGTTSEKSDNLPLPYRFLNMSLVMFEMSESTISSILGS